MTTITRFTKEQLIARAREKVKSLEFAVTQTAFDENRAELEEELELARIALASLDAKPVAWRYRTTDINGNPNPDWSFSEGASLMGLYQPLYTAPPVPVVPDEIEPDDGNTFDYVDGWNACRAAMLQGKTAGNSPVIPEGYALVPIVPTEDMLHSLLQGAEPVTMAYKLPDLKTLDTVKFNADCALQDPESIYAQEFFMSVDEAFGERGNYTEPVQAKAVSMLIAEIFRLRGYQAAPQQEK